MTLDDLGSDVPPVPDSRAAIDALLDGEPVNKNALLRALDDDEARRYLVEVLLLRQLTQDMGPARFEMPGQPSSWRRPVRWLAAATVVLTTATGGYLYGQQSRPRPSSVEAMIAAPADTPPAPAPTRIIRFEPGINWSDNTGSR